MADDRRWLLVPQLVRNVPADLATVLLLVGLTNLAVFLPVVRDLPFRIALAVPFLFFLPGYAVVSLLYPEAAPMFPDEEGAGLTGLERAAISVGLSLLLVPAVVFLVDLSPLRIALAPVVLGVSLLALSATAGAVARRRRLPSEERFSIPYREWGRGLRSSFTTGEREERAFNVAMALLIVLSAGGLVYLVAAPTPAEPYTLFYIATERADGELAAEYPREFVVGEPQELTVVVENHEHEPRRYSTVVLLQRMGPNGTEVRESRELQRFRAELAANGTWRRQHEVVPPMTGERLQLTYLLYTGDPPSTPTRETAYRTLHFEVTVRNATTE